jgi:hypothetical protein
MHNKKDRLGICPTCKCFTTDLDSHKRYHEIRKKVGFKKGDGSDA